MQNCWSRFIQSYFSGFRPLAITYQVLSSASVDELWRTVVNLADVSWHPLLARTNAPNGLLPKPGLIYRAVTRLIPIPIQIFVENVSPHELLSIRLFALPGVEERVTYRVESTLCGTRVSYSVTLRGWLSPLVWSIIRPFAERVAAELAHAAEQAHQKSDRPSQMRDLLGTVLLVCVVSRSNAC